MARAQDSQAKAPVRQCLSCDSTKLSNEHIFPDWLVRRYKARLRSGKGSFKAMFSKWDGIVKTWNQPTITQKRRLMCAPCNNHKLGSVEQVVSPLLIPYIERPLYPHSIPRDEQVLLAGWIIARAMIWDGMAPPERRFYTYSQRLAFSDSNPTRLPSNTKIWIAPSDSAYRVGATVGNHLVNDEDGLNITTGLLGHIAFQLVAWKGKGWHINEGALRRDGWDAATEQIWPLRRRAIEWPPAYYLDRVGLKAFAQRLGSTAAVFAS